MRQLNWLKLSPKIGQLAVDFGMVIMRRYMDISDVDLEVNIRMTVR